MVEAFLLGLYILILSPVLFSLGVEDPYAYFLIMFILTLPGIYAMFRGAPFVPTAQKRVQKMVKIAKITNKSIIYDLGSGDGRFIFAAAKAGAKNAIGYELSLPIYLLSKFRSFFIPNAEFRYKDFWFDSEKFKNADVIFCFLMIKPMAKFESKIWPHLKPGCLVVSNVFRLPGIKPIKEVDGIRVYKK
jgi:SAM-dependent methyltransferase